MASARHGLTSALVSLTLSVGTAAFADDALPKRKPGLWETSMVMDAATGRPPMKMQQCVNEKTDQAMQQKMFIGSDPKSKCGKPVVKKTNTGLEFNATCTTDEGTVHSAGRLTGNTQTKYTVENTMTFDPPRHGLATSKVTITATHRGACPRDLKPGEVRLAGGPGRAVNPMQLGGSAIDVEKLKNMTPAERQKWAEEMQKAAQQMQKSAAPE
ncbi:MAG: hypothetical protein JNG84_01335 [Archangium sp.]|nr:hypothetical protein [Archangium sp.]